MPIPTRHAASPRPLLREHVYLTIRNAIVRGELAPGERVRDTELGDWLGVSRTPVREALLRLEQAQLVQTQPGRTTIIAPEDPEAVQHARQIVAELQALAARLATPRLDEQQLGILRATNEALGKALLTGDIEAAITADDAFHDLMVQACGNPLVGQHLEPLMATLRRTEYLHFAASSRPNSVQAHDAIIRACEQGDAELAARLVRENWSALNDPIGATQPLREERTEP